MIVSIIVYIINNIIIIERRFLVLILGYSIFAIVDLPLLASFERLRLICTSK